MNAFRMTCLAVAVLGIVSPLQAQSTLRVLKPMQQSASGADNGGCAAAKRSSGLCFGSPQFSTYIAAAYACSQIAGRLPSLGELVAYRFGAGSAETGIDCSSDWDAGSGTLWCVGNGGAISGTSLQQQAESLGKLKAEFRCVTYLKQ